MLSRHTSLSSLALVTVVACSSPATNVGDLGGDGGTSSEGGGSTEGGAGSGGSSGSSGGSTSSSSGGTSSSSGGTGSSSGAPVGTVGANGGSLSSLLFAVVGDTRPPNEDELTSYPTAIITKIFADVQARSPAIPFVVSTGDYQFSSTGSNSTASQQLSLYLQAREQYTGVQFTAMGNHECTGADDSNCPASSSSPTANYKAFMSQLLALIRRASPEASRDRIVEEFKIWTLDGERAAWELFRTAPYSPNQPPKDEDDVPRAAGGATTFKQIPILELAVPAGLWVGNKLGVLAREHFQRRSALNAAENKSLFAIPYVKLGPEVTAPGAAMPAEVQQNPSRGRDPRGEFNRRGYVVLGKDDGIGFAEPAGTAYELVDRQLEKLVDEMFRVVHQMASSVSATKQALARSGASKGEDRRATEIVLGAYGALVRDFAKRIYDCLSAARGEDVVWTTHGLDKFELEDRDGILKEALSLDAIAIPSATFRKSYKTKIALALVGNVPPETQDVIREEIERGVEQEGELDAHARAQPIEDDDNRDEDGPPAFGRSRGGAAPSPGA